MPSNTTPSKSTPPPARREVEAEQAPAASREADVEQAKRDNRDTARSNDPEVQSLNPISEPNTRIATNVADLPDDRPGFHCGYCGQPVGPEGQHWDEKGEATGNPHAGTLVVADNWPEVRQDTSAPADTEADGPVSDTTRTDGISK